MRLFLKKSFVGSEHFARDGCLLGLRLGFLEVDSGEPGAIRGRQKLGNDVSGEDRLGRSDLLGGDVAARRDNEDVAAAGDAGAPTELVERPGKSNRRVSEQSKELSQPGRSGLPPRWAAFRLRQT
jgi:hypothetical protein